MPDTAAPDHVYYLYSEDIWRCHGDLDKTKAAGIDAIAGCVVDEAWMPIEDIRNIRIVQVSYSAARDLDEWVEDEDMPPDAMVVTGIVKRFIVRDGENLSDYHLVDVEPYRLR